MCLAVGLESPPLTVSEERQLAVLTELPFVVPFEERVKVSPWFLWALVAVLGPVLAGQWSAGSCSPALLSSPTDSSLCFVLLALRINMPAKTSLISLFKFFYFER